MNNSVADKLERSFFRYAVVMAFLIHVSCALFLIWSGNRTLPAEQFTPLASMDFSPFDPEGGEPGGGGNNLHESEESPVPPPPPLPEPEEAERIDPDEDLKVVESKAENAEPVAPPEKTKPKPKTPKKLLPRPSPAPAAQGDSSTAGSGPGDGSQTSGQGRGGSGGETGQGNPDAQKAYLAHILKKLNRHKKYPAAAKANRLAGVVTVNFSVNRQGQVTSSRLVKSSGHVALDQEAMALLKRVSPFQAMPEAVSVNSMNLNVPIRFSVQ